VNLKLANILLVFCFSSGALKAQENYDKWQLNNNLAIVHSQLGVSIVESVVPGLSNYEGNACLTIGEVTYTLSGTNFFKGSSQISAEIRGNTSSSQGSYLVLLPDTNKILLVSSYQGLGGAITFSVFNRSTDLFEVFNKEIREEGSERLHFYASEKICMYTTSIDGHIQIWEFFPESLEWEKKAQFRGLPNGSADMVCQIKLSNSSNFIGVTSSRDSFVAIYAYDTADHSICLIELINASFPYGLEFSPNDKYLYFSELGNSIKRIRLDSTFNVEPIITDTRGVGSITISSYGNLFYPLLDQERIGVIEGLENQEIRPSDKFYLSLPVKLSQLSLVSLPILNFKNRVLLDTFRCLDVPWNFRDIKDRPKSIDDILWIPNAYSPNGDSRNDNFKIVANPIYLDSIIDFSIEIFTIKGNRVFASENVHFNFDPNRVYNASKTDTRYLLANISFSLMGEEYKVCRPVYETN